MLVRVRRDDYDHWMKRHKCGKRRFTRIVQNVILDSEADWTCVALQPRPKHALGICYCKTLGAMSGPEGKEKEMYAVAADIRDVTQTTCLQYCRWLLSGGAGEVREDRREMVIDFRGWACRRCRWAQTLAQPR